MSKIRGKGLLGVKVGMTSIFNDAGDQVPVTVVLAGPNTVLGVKPTADGKFALTDGPEPVLLFWDLTTSSP